MTDLGILAVVVYVSGVAGVTVAAARRLYAQAWSPDRVDAFLCLTMGVIVAIFWPVVVRSGSRRSSSNAGRRDCVV